MPLKMYFEEGQAVKAEWVEDEKDLDEKDISTNENIERKIKELYFLGWELAPFTWVNEEGVEVEAPEYVFIPCKNHGKLKKN